MQYSVLINTCDKFEDCWDPFFKLWSLYWSDCKGSVYLNTELKDYSYDGLDITAVRCLVNKPFKTKHVAWSRCLRIALESIDTDILLYMQEDYFLKAPVKNDEVEAFVSLMESNEQIKCIHLTDQSVLSSGQSEFEHLDNVMIDQRYRVSCQAALWRKDELLALLKDYESGWEFEEFGSRRSAYMGHRYLCVNHNHVKLDEYEIIPYIFTGIVQGRWFEQTVPLFEKHEIQMDWSRRGMLSDAPKKPFIKRISHRLIKLSKSLRNTLHLS